MLKLVGLFEFVEDWFFGLLIERGGRCRCGFGFFYDIVGVVEIDVLFVYKVGGYLGFGKVNVIKVVFVLDFFVFDFEVV